MNKKVIAIVRVYKWTPTKYIEIGINNYMYVKDCENAEMFENFHNLLLLGFIISFKNSRAFNIHSSALCRAKGSALTFLVSFFFAFQTKTFYFLIERAKKKNIKNKRWRP